MTHPTPPTGDPTGNDVRLVEERLSAVAVAVRPPVVAPADDVARGRRRVRRQRGLVLGSALATASVVAVAALTLGGGSSGGESLIASSPSNGPTATDPTTDPTTDPAPTEPPTPVDTRDAKELLTDYRDVIAEYLDPRDRHLQRVPDNLQSGGGLGTKLGWSNPGEDGLGMVEVFVSRNWREQAYLWCDRYQSCRDVSVGPIRARVLEEDGVTWVGVERADGSVAVLSVNALFGNNSLVPVSGIDASIAELARIAADERLTLATPEQERGASEAFGFPELPMGSGIESGTVG